MTQQRIGQMGTVELHDGRMVLVVAVAGGQRLSMVNGDESIDICHMNGTNYMTVTGKGRRAGTLERWAEVMGWPEYAGTQHGLREAIPPVYSHWIGLRLFDVLTGATAA